jgi:hypothetical protein
MEYDSSYSNFFLPESGSKPPSTPIARRVIFFSGPSLCWSVGIYKKSDNIKTWTLNCSKAKLFCLVRIIWINIHTCGHIRKTTNTDSSPTVCLEIITPPPCLPSTHPTTSHLYYGNHSVFPFEITVCIGIYREM